jgi:putative radical SAM enzyme (TIGR03279 family)
MKIVQVEPGSIAEELGLRPGDDVLAINGERLHDAIDLRFHEGGETVELSVAREGEVTLYDIGKEDGEPLGIELEEMSILSCGNDCIFCFVDQNPKGLRKQLYFRDGDYRLSFMYGNYTTMTNAGPAILRRIIQQRLSPQYISVHVTDLAVRSRLMGLKKDDRILEKIALLRDNGIDMHTQIVLCPGINDGPVLEKTVDDLAKYSDRIVSLAIVPVGLTDHRFRLAKLRRVDFPMAGEILDTVRTWQRKFRSRLGRGFVYASDEFYLLAGRPVPGVRAYDGFPQLENGVGMVRHFLQDLGRQARRFPASVPHGTRLTLVTAELAQGVIRDRVLPHLRAVRGLLPRLVVAPNLLFGRSVTVAGLLSGKCLYSALSGADPCGLVLLPPDVLNADGLFLDDTTPSSLEERLGVPVYVYDGRWSEVFSRLTKGRSRRSTATSALLVRARSDSSR